MPILGSLASASVQAYGSRGLVPTGSALFNSVNDYLTVPASTAFQYGTGDFTIEMWIYPTTASSFSGLTLFRQRGADYRNQRYLFLFLWPSRQIFLQVPGNDFFVGTQNLVDLNAWNHVALVRRSGQMQIFLNGYANTPRANTTNYTDTSAYNLAFGNLVFNNQYTFQGNISNIRIAKSAYYVTSFIPNRTPFTSTSQGATNVQLLLNFKNTAGLNTDSSANNITVTNSSVTYSTLTPFSGAFVTPPVVNAATATITPSTLSVDEGSSISFTVATSNVSNGTYYWTIELPADAPPSTADFSGSVLSGTFTITSSSGSFNITTIADLVTEGVETFSVFVRSGSTTGIVLGVTDEITINDTSLTPAFTVNPGGMDEGASATYTAINLGPAGTYYWTIAYNTGTSDADFSPFNGSFTTSTLNGEGTFSVNAVADRLTEGQQTYQVQVRSGSISGPVILTSNAQSINDISLTPAFTVTPSSIIEGNAGSFSVNNLGPAGTYYWTILNGTTDSTDFSASSGSFTTATLNGTGSFSITTVLDTTLDTNETFQVQIRTGSISGTVIVTSSSVTLTDASIQITLGSYSLIEGTNTLVTIQAGAGTPTGTYSIVLEGVSAGFTSADIFSPVFPRSVSLGPSQSTTFSIFIDAAGGSEAAETFRLRADSSGAVVYGRSLLITIPAN